MCRLKGNCHVDLSPIGSCALKGGPLVGRYLVLCGPQRVPVFIYLLTPCQLLVGRNVCTMTTPLSCARCSIQCEFVGIRPKLNFSGSVAMVLHNGLSGEASAEVHMETKRSHCAMGCLAMR